MQAKAAIESGLRKGNARERSALHKISNDVHENRRREQMTNSTDSSRYPYSTCSLCFLMEPKNCRFHFTFLKDNATSLEVLVSTLMHKECFQDHHVKQVMMKKMQE